jgi:hypothetical protein
MSRLGISTGNNPNDGQGDPLRVAMGKINSNFLEIYNTIGNGFDLVSYASTAGISTLAQNLTGSPRINVSGILNTGITTTEHIEVRNIKSTGVVTATQFVGDGSQLTNVTALVGGLEVLDDSVRKGVARELNFGENIISTGPDGVGRVTISVPSIVASATYADSAGISSYADVAGIATISINAGFAETTNTSNYSFVSGISSYSDFSGIATQSSISGYADVSGISTIAFGITGTPNIVVGVVTADSYNGSGSRLTGVITSLVAGVNISILQSAGIATINAIGGGGGVGESYWSSDVLGIHTTKKVGINTTSSDNYFGLYVREGIDVEGFSIINNVGFRTTNNGLFNKFLMPNFQNTVGGAGNGYFSAIQDNQLNDEPFEIRYSGKFTRTLQIGTSFYSRDGNPVLYPNVFIDGGKATISVGAAITINGQSGIITAPTFSGNLEGNVTGNVTGNATGLAGTPDITLGIVTATRFESLPAGTPTIGAATSIKLDTITVGVSTDLTVGRNANVSGVVTSTGGFISVGNTTPIQISLVGNQLTFTAVGIGSTTLTLF